MARSVKHILCVEDHEDTCSMLRVLLSGYKVTTVGTCAEALQKANARLINLYLLDNWLPDGTGIELCNQIHKLDPNTPILFYSAAAYDNDRKAAIKAGAKDYLVKPVDITKLADTISMLILQSEMQSLEAKVAELEAIHDHIHERHEMIAGKLDRAKRIILKHKALMAFINAGGNRANFARMWPEILKTEISDSQ